MSCSKLLPPFLCDSLYYLNRDQLERFSIVCRPLKNFIDRYLHTMPYRVFDWLWIRGGSCGLVHNKTRWHLNRDDYSAQQFLAGEALAGDALAGEELHYHAKYYSFAEMRPYLGQTVRIKETWIDVGTTYLGNGITYNPEEMESMAHLWCNRKIIICNGDRIVAEDIQLILNLPTILHCRYLHMIRAQFSFKDYKLLYNAKIIENSYGGNETNPDYWLQFLEQPGAKPLVVLHFLCRKSITTVVDHLSKSFSSAVSPNAFKIVFAENRKALTKFQKTNDDSGEKLELKEGLPTGYQNAYLDANLNRYFNYTLERSMI